MDSDKYCLRWNEYPSNLSNAFNELRNDEDFFDITLITEESEIRCHKLILGACSPHFLQMIKRLNSQLNPAIYLRGVRHEDIKNILEFMYLGVVNVCQEDLESFLSVAQDLCIKGLTQNDNYSPSSSSSSHPSHQGVKRTYKSSNGDIVKTSYPKKEPKIEPGISLEHPDEHVVRQDEDIGEDYGNYGNYEAGPSCEEPNYVDSSSILFKDGQFEAVSKVRKAFCWKYFLLDEENLKAKCKVKFSEGRGCCDKVFSVKGYNGCVQVSGTINKHLENEHGITPVLTK